ncbi:leucine-rich repeat domain-containing protein, partial [Shigella boydii]
MNGIYILNHKRSGKKKDYHRIWDNWA